MYMTRSSSLVEADVRPRDNPDMTKKDYPAHYTNESFQPEIWQPGSDYETDGSGKTVS